MKPIAMKARELGVAIEEIKAIAKMAANCCPDGQMVPVFGAIERLAEHAGSMTGELELLDEERDQ